MLPIPLKKGGSRGVDLVKPVQAYIESDWSKEDAEACAEGLNELQTMHNKAHGVTEQGGKAARDQLLQYIHALDMLHTRVDIARTNGKLKVVFSWTDAYGRKKAQQENAVFERAAIVFNFGALLSHEACAKDHTTDEGLKAAYNLFSEAIGAFDYLRSDLGRALDASSLTTDLSEDGLTFASALMTAQAQQCFYMKANLGGMSRGVLAKLAQGTAEAYSLVSGMLEAGPMKSAMSGQLLNTWKSYLQCSTKWFTAEAQYKLACEDLEKIAIGHQIARLTLAEATLGEASPFLKHAPAEQQEKVQQLRDQVTIALREARSDNETIYLLPVPDASSIQSPVPKQMVKAKVCMHCGVC